MIVVVAACGSSEEDDECFVGDRAAAPDIAIVHRTLGGEWADVTPGTELALILPPQGFKVLMIGVRARNVNGCGLQLTGSLLDEGTGRLYGTEQRPVMLVPEGEWLVPARPAALSNYANVSVCPNPEAERDLYDQPWSVRVRIRDVEGRTAEATVSNVVPVCAEPEVEGQCRCECSRGYVLGQVCPR